MKEVEKVKIFILDMNIPNKKVRKAIENLTTARQKDKEEILSLLKEKRPVFYSE